jgi:hypothetical protein
MRWDAGAYFVLGTSIAEGKGYRLLNEPGEPRAIQYPPGLPILVAAHQKALGTSDFVTVGRWLRLTFYLMSVALAIATFLLFRSFVPPAEAALATFVAVFMVATGDALAPEEPFALVVVLFTLAAMRRGRSYDVAAGLMAIIAFMIRTAGIAVLLAWALEAVLRRDWRSGAIRLLVAAIPVVAWQAYVVSVQRSGEYSAPAYEYQRAPYLFNNVSYAENLRLADPFHPEFGETTAMGAVIRSVRLLPKLPEAIGTVVTTSRESWSRLLHFDSEQARRAGLRWKLSRVIPIVAGIIAMAGIVVLAVRGEYLIALLVLGTIATVVAAPWPVNWPRYLSPVGAHLVLAAIAATRSLAATAGQHILPRASRLPGTAVVGALGVMCVVRLLDAVEAERHFHHPVSFTHRDGSRISYRLYGYEARHAEMDAAVDWLMPRLRSPDEVIVSTMPFRVYLRTGVKSVLPPASTDSLEVLRLLDGIPATYLVLGGSRAIVWAEHLVNPVVRASTDRWVPIHTTQGGRIVLLWRRPPPG